MSTIKKLRNLLVSVLSLAIIGFIAFCVFVSVRQSKSAAKSSNTNGIADRNTDSLSAGYANNVIEKQIHEMTLGQQLAVIESGRERSPSDPYVVKLDKLLNELSEKYHEPKDTIAEYTNKARKSLKRHDVMMSAADLMNEVVITKRYNGIKYKDILLLYCVIHGKEGR